MKVYSIEQPEVYAVSGQELRIHWNIKEVVAPGMDEPQTQWEADEALCFVYDTRAQIIEKIIGSAMDTGAEIAKINNKETNPEEYAAYQAFRAEAKALADGWLNKE